MPVYDRVVLTGGRLPVVDGVHPGCKPLHPAGFRHGRAVSRSWVLRTTSGLFVTVRITGRIGSCPVPVSITAARVLPSAT